MSAKGSFDGLDWIGLLFVVKVFFRKPEESDCLSPITPLLRSKADMPDEVLDIVGDHHERQDGKGYPKGIKGNLIYDLANIVSIANFFDHKVGESKKELLYEQQLEAISILAKDNAMIFEPAKLQKAIKIFERTFSSLKYEP